MYRDDPLDDEQELRDLLGDDAVDGLLEIPAGADATRPVEIAVELLRILQGWADDRAVSRWFATPQRRLDGRSPVEALAGGAVHDVREAARRWAAAQS